MSIQHRGECASIGIIKSLSCYGFAIASIPPTPLKHKHNRRGHWAVAVVLAAITVFISETHSAAQVQAEPYRDLLDKVTPKVRDALSHLQGRPALYAIGMKEIDLDGANPNDRATDQGTLYGQSLALAYEDSVGVSPYFVVRALKEATHKSYPRVNGAVETWVALANSVLAARSAEDFARLGDTDTKKALAGGAFHDAISAVAISNDFGDDFDRTTQLGQFIVAMEREIYGVEKRRAEQGLEPLKSMPAIADTATQLATPMGGSGAGVASILPRGSETPSFDCSKAKTAPARLICADGELAKLDGELGRVFQKRKSATPTTDQMRFVSEQLAWLRGRNTECQLIGKNDAALEALAYSKPCMISMIRERISFLTQNSSPDYAVPASNESVGAPVEIHPPLIQNTGQDAPKTECDTYAAKPDDPNRKADGVVRMELMFAIPACEIAVKTYPESWRLHFQLGRGYYANGRFNSARAEFEVAADHGYAAAQAALGAIYAGHPGVPRDDVLALAWYRKSAEQGYVVAQDNVGRAYADGRGVPTDDAEAVSWFRRAADQGYAAAQGNIGVMYRDGRGVPKDEAQAAFWFQKAANQGSAEATAALASLYSKNPALREQQDSSAVAASTRSTSSAGTLNIGKGPESETGAAQSPSIVPSVGAAALRADPAVRIAVGSGPAKRIPKWVDKPVYARSGVPACFKEDDFETLMALIRDGKFDASKNMPGCFMLPAGVRVTVLKTAGLINVYFKVAIPVADGSPLIVWSTAYGFQNADDPGEFK